LVNKLGDQLARLDRREEALAIYRNGVSAAEQSLAADPNQAQRRWDLAVLNWKLASLDDDPRRRLAFTVATIRGLKAQGELTVNQNLTDFDDVT
jgi:hypothetical protein